MNKILHSPMLRTYGGTLVALLLLGVLFSLLSDNFFSTRNLSNVLLQMTVIAILAFGMTFVLMLGEIDLSVGSIAALAGVTLGVTLRAGAPWPVAILATLVVGAICGFINGSVSAYLGIPTFIVTVATMGIFRGVGYAMTDSKPVPVTNEAVIAAGNDAILGVPMPVLIMVIVLIALSILLSRTKYGRQMMLTGGNRTAARFAGVRTQRLQVSVFVVMGLAAALSGILLTSRLYSAQPNAAEGYELDAIAAAVLGGTSLTGGQGTVVGTFIGALIIAVVNNGMNLLGLEYYFQDIVKGLIIIVAVFIDVRNKKARLER